MLRAKEGNQEGLLFFGDFETRDNLKTRGMVGFGWHEVKTSNFNVDSYHLLLALDRKLIIRIRIFGNDSERCEDSAGHTNFQAK
jgi:hypothetical protein